MFFLYDAYCVLFIYLLSVIYILFQLNHSSRTTASLRRSTHSRSSSLPLIPSETFPPPLHEGVLQSRGVLQPPYTMGGLAQGFSPPPELADQFEAIDVLYQTRDADVGRVNN